MSNVIELANVTKRFGSQAALDDVSIAVPRGVVFALLGENGAGKTDDRRMKPLGTVRTSRVPRCPSAALPPL